MERKQTQTKVQKADEGKKCDKANGVRGKTREESSPKWSELGQKLKDPVTEVTGGVKSKDSSGRGPRRASTPRLLVPRGSLLEWLGEPGPEPSAQPSPALVNTPSGVNQRQDSKMQTFDCFFNLGPKSLHNSITHYPITHRMSDF